MDLRTLTKLAILAEKDPGVEEQLTKQAQAITDEELYQAVGGSDHSRWLRQKNANPGIYR